MVKQELSHRERLEICLSGNRPDRIPVALWRHFPVDDQSPENLASAILAFQQTYDFDLVKVTPSSSFCIQDWGATDTWNGNIEGTRDYNAPVISKPEDWFKLPVLDPRAGALAHQIRCLHLLATEGKGTAPVMQTIFSPLAQAKNLAGKTNLVTYLRRYPEALHAGLETITQSTIRFIEACAENGIAGIFYAVQHANYNLLSVPEFLEFSKAYDFRVLKETGRFWLNMAHIHGENLMFDQVVDYPVQILNWHDRHTQPDLREAKTRFAGVVCGGLRRLETMTLGTPQEIEQEARDAVDQTNGLRFILGTGCVLPITTPHGNILKARQLAEHL